LQFDFRLFLQPFLVSFLRIASLYFIFFYFGFFLFWKKSEFWGITQNWVMTVAPLFTMLMIESLVRDFK
jgi:hypothetical protein